MSEIKIMAINENIIVHLDQTMGLDRAILQFNNFLSERSISLTKILPTLGIIVVEKIPKSSCAECLSQSIIRQPFASYIYKYRVIKQEENGEIVERSGDYKQLYKPIN